MWNKVFVFFMELQEINIAKTARIYIFFMGFSLKMNFKIPLLFSILISSISILVINKYLTPKNNIIIVTIDIII